MNELDESRTNLLHDIPCAPKTSLQKSLGLSQRSVQRICPRLIYRGTRLWTLVLRSLREDTHILIRAVKPALPPS
jgi:hypothetical protein